MSGYAEYTMTTPEFRGTFVTLVDPKQVERKDKNTGEIKMVDQWKTGMLFPADETLKEMKDLATKLMNDKFGAKENWPKPFHAANNPNGWAVPWRKQWEKCEDNPDIDKSYDGFEKEGLFLNASTSRQPEVVDAKRKPIIKKSELYSGAYYIASITLFWYDNESKGIGVSLGPVMKVRDGETLGGGGITAAEAFAGVEIDEGEDAGSVFDETDDEEDPFA